MENYNRLLKRQIAKYLDGGLLSDEKMKNFLKSIQEAYSSFEKDHDQLERTLELNSNELYKANLSLKEKVEQKKTDLEVAYSGLQHEKSARESYERKQAFTEELLNVANDAINKLIQCENIDEAFTLIFEDVVSVGQMDDIIMLINSGYNSRNVGFNVWGRHSKEESEVVERLLFILNTNFEAIEKELLKNRPCFLRDLESIVDKEKAAKNKGDFKNLICPVVIRGKLHSISVYHSKNGRTWSSLEQGILSRLTDSAANLINQKDLEKNIKRQGQAIIETQQFSKIGTFEIDFIEGFSSFTEQASHLLDLTSEELLFDEDLIMRLRKNVVPEDLSMIDVKWKDAVEMRSEIRLDFRVKHSNETVHHLNWNLQPTYSNSGKIIKVRGTLQDITERVMIEKKSKTAELIIENSPSVLFRWKVEEGWPVEYVSANVSQFGYSVEDFSSQKIKFGEIIHYDDYSRIMNEIDENRREGNRTYQQAYRIFNSSGEIRWVEDLTLTEEDDSGIVKYHQGIITDITEKKLAQLALEERETRFRNLVQNSSDITTILNDEGLISYESPIFYRLFGFTEEQILGKHLVDLIHSDDKNAFNEFISKLKVSEKETHTILFRMPTKSGDWIYLEAIGNNLFSEPSIAGIVINSRDVTERVESDQQLKEYANNLEKINKELDQFAYIVSHDLKAPLRAINNLADWIAEDLESVMEDDTKKNLSLMKGRISRMEALINGILQYSRAGRMKAESVEIPINDFVNDIILNLAPPENFVVHIQENMPMVKTEKIAFEQVFSNFISNAIKYNSNPEPEVFVGYEDRNDLHCFFVKDNGPGISQEFHTKVFAIFQTLQARDSVESTGVGLAIVKKIVEENGGEAWVESSIGEGATFFFTIPKN
jgi:PAS domain S-box-containing protein